MVVERDPSIHSRREALLHPVLPAVWTHRVSHWLYSRGFRFAAKALASAARLASGGIELHPGARLGQRVFIDHGVGVVVGETAVIGDDVTLYHQVTLGAVGWKRDSARPPGERRHPSIGNRVTVGANATILGPVTIGDDAVIGAQALVIADVPAGARVLAPAAVVQVPGRAKPVRQLSIDQEWDLLRVNASAGSW